MLCDQYLRIICLVCVALVQAQTTSISPTMHPPTAVTDGSTLVPTAGICFEITITFKGIFLPALENALSEAFKNFANAIIELLRWLFMDFTGAEITCEAVIFRKANGREAFVFVKVRIIVLANNSAHAKDIENYALNITSMDIGNITANNETYIACAVNTTATCDKKTTESTTMATTTLGTTPSSTTGACKMDIPVEVLAKIARDIGKEHTVSLAQSLCRFDKDKAEEFEEENKTDKNEGIFQILVIWQCMEKLMNPEEDCRALILTETLLELGLKEVVKEHLLKYC